MKIRITILAALIGLSTLVLPPPSLAAGEYQLSNGMRGVIDGKRLILIGRDSKRWYAPDGRYYTRDGVYVIVVKNGEIVIRDLTKEPR